MAKKTAEFPSVYRTDVLSSNMTATKKTKVIDLLHHYRKGAVMLGREQWRLFFETGKFNKQHDVDKVTFAHIIGAATRVQMCRYQVVGQLQSWISNRTNEFRDTVVKSNLSPDVKHMLNTINRMNAWFLREDVLMARTNEIIPTDIRRLARSIMRHIMKRHSRPDLRHISMWLDSRAAIISEPVKAKQAGKIGWWVNMSTMEKGQKIKIPLLTYDYHANRSGKIANGVQVNLNREGKLTFGLVTDIGGVCAKSRADYDGKGVLALDFGLSTLFATSEGQLLSQKWLVQLRKYDRIISNITKGFQRRGGKPRDSVRYRKETTALRGFIRTEIGRVINRLIEQNKPAELVLERLDFRNSQLSRRLNAILSNCGRSVIKSKLADIKENFGIAATEINPAYTSQTCSKCGYVDKKNRLSQSKFKCLWCGHELHADLNAARNIKERRDASIGYVFLGKAAVLVELVHNFNTRVDERTIGNYGVPADPRLKNPYFG